MISVIRDSTWMSEVKLGKCFSLSEYSAIITWVSQIFDGSWQVFMNDILLIHMPFWLYDWCYSVMRSFKFNI